MGRIFPTRISNGDYISDLNIYGIVLAVGILFPAGVIPITVTLPQILSAPFMQVSVRCERQSTKPTPIPCRTDPRLQTLLETPHGYFLCELSIDAFFVFNRPSDSVQHVMRSNVEGIRLRVVMPPFSYCACLEESRKKIVDYIRNTTVELYAIS